jgi:solute:Na+ symporter, SSS family
MNPGTFGSIDIIMIFAYSGVLIGMGIYFTRKSGTAEQFMVAGRSIPAWAAGLAIMSASTSSISYIATPGKAFDTNWHPLIFALCIPPVVWLINKYVVPFYIKIQVISVYSMLEEKLGMWARVYAALSFVLYMIGRAAVILYLAGLLLSNFVSWNLMAVIIVIGVITILYTLLGGMEAVIWTDVMQSVIMIFGILICVGYLTVEIFSQPDFLIKSALDANKFSLGDWELSLSSRTVWVMIIYGVTENLRDLLADQNYVQKYSSVASAKEATRSIWISTLIYIPLTIIFLYIGTALFAYYSGAGHVLADSVTKGDQVFPYFIATQLPAGMKGLIVAAILAAAMSTIDSALNCSATVLFLDFFKRYVKPQISEKGSVLFLRISTALWGILGTGFALLIIQANSALDIWWEVSGIFGGGILGLFILYFLKIRLRLWQGLVSIAASMLLIAWATFARNLPAEWQWAQCNIEEIIIGTLGTAALLIVAFAFHLMNKRLTVNPAE